MPDSGRTAFAMKRRCDRFRVPGRDPEQGEGRTIRRAAALLPVPEGRDTDADHVANSVCEAPSFARTALTSAGRNRALRGGFSTPRRIRPACRMLETNF